VHSTCFREWENQRASHTPLRCVFWYVFGVSRPVLWDLFVLPRRNVG
jgi:hypothetical protein